MIILLILITSCVSCYAQLTNLQQHGFHTFYVLSYPGRGSILYNGWPSNCFSSLKLVQLISGCLENVYHISRAWLPPERTSYRSKSCHYFRLGPVHLLFAFPDALLQICDLFSEWLKLVLYPLNVFIWNTKWLRAIFAVSFSSSCCCCCFLLHNHGKKKTKERKEAIIGLTNEGKCAFAATDWLYPSQWYSQTPHNTDSLLCPRGNKALTFLSIDLINWREEVVTSRCRGSKILGSQQTVVLQICQKETKNLGCFSSLWMIALRNKTVARYFSSIDRHCKWPSLSRKTVEVQKFFNHGNVT